MEFVYEPTSVRVLFGLGASGKAAAETARIGRRALVICTPEQRGLADEVAHGLGRLAVDVFDGAAMHVPVSVADAAAEACDRADVDCCVCVGGGSTTGLGKALALSRKLPILAIPTTYAGSEMTPIWGLTGPDGKRTGRDATVLPRTVIYDALLTVGLPPALSATSGMNAIAHCVEALYAPDVNPIVSLMARDGIRALAGALGTIVASPDDLPAREAALYGAWLGGACLGAVQMSLHHKLCHVLGGLLNLPHAETHTLMLPHVAAYNEPAALDAMRHVAEALGSRRAATGLFDLASRLGARMSLAELGVPEAALDRVAEAAVENRYANPRPFDRASVRALLADAHVGRRPPE